MSSKGNYFSLKVRVFLLFYFYPLLTYLYLFLIIFSSALEIGIYILNLHKQWGSIFHLVTLDTSLLSSQVPILFLLSCTILITFYTFTFYTSKSPFPECYNLRYYHLVYLLPFLCTIVIIYISVCIINSKLQLCYFYF